MITINTFNTNIRMKKGQAVCETQKLKFNSAWAVGSIFQPFQTLPDSQATELLLRLSASGAWPGGLESILNVARRQFNSTHAPEKESHCPLQRAKCAEKNSDRLKKLAPGHESVLNRPGTIMPPTRRELSAGLSPSGHGLQQNGDNHAG